VKAVRHLALDEHREPVNEPDDECRDSAQRDPDDEWNGQEQAEEHGQPAALQVVVAHDEPHRPLRNALHGRILMHH
jgi:hypothetical protein